MLRHYERLKSKHRVLRLKILYRIESLHRSFAIAGDRALANEMIGERSASIADFRAALALEPTLYAAAQGLKRLGAEVQTGAQAGE